MKLLGLISDATVGLIVRRFDTSPAGLSGSHAAWTPRWPERAFSAAEGQLRLRFILLIVLQDATTPWIYRL